MSPLNTVRAVGLFFWRFVVGDDPMVAAAMLLALGLTATLVAQAINAWWFVPVVALAVTGMSISRRSRRTASAR